MRVYEKRGKFRYQIKKDVLGQSNVIRGLSACAIQKFNGYEMIRKKLKKKEEKHIEPLEVVSEPVMDNSAIKCFFTDSLHLIFRSYVDKKK